MLSQTLKRMGVVGAGGAGIPTNLKAEAKDEYVIANGAECEPLLHKDVELMQQFPAQIISGMRLMMEATGAARGRFGLKEKNQKAIQAIEPEAKAHGIDLVLLGDFYPSGDEYELVYEATGRLIPPAGIPLQVGCVVNNVETLYNVHYASRGVPVTRKFVSVSGAVRKPKAFWVPVGTPFRELLEIAGGPTAADIALFVNGIMMGKLSFDLEDVVSRTTAGLIVLPKDHYLVTRKNRSQRSMDHIGKSACDQCSYCTEFCPRYLLGYEVQPHKVMRSLGFTLTGRENWNQWAELCCACGLCTLYACPEDLFPKEACDRAKADMRAAGIKFVQQAPVRVHPLKEARRVPLKMLRKRLRVEEYETDTPFDPVDWRPKRVRLLLAQHVGKPAMPVVREGDTVGQDDTIATVGEKDLGVNIHASIDGKIARVTDTWIEIEA